MNRDYDDAYVVARLLDTAMGKMARYAKWLVVGGVIMLVAAVVFLMAMVVAAQGPAAEPVVVTANADKPGPRPATVPLPGEVVGPGASSAPEPWTQPPELAPEATGPERYLGEFTVYAYCPCAQCCGDWSPQRGGPGLTASGTVPEAGRTIAVDPDVIPLGSLVLVGGAPYIAEDTGAGVDGMSIDIYMESHQAAREHGVQTMAVWIIQ